MKLWRPGHDIATHATPIIPGRTYHLKVQASGSRIQVWLDGALVIDAADTTYGDGRLGLNVHAGTATAQNLTIAGSAR